jgi:hypothetical protein
MEYNTTRNKLIIPEYGRNVQKMVDYAITLKDRDKRNRLANLIVNVMAQLHPNNKDVADYKQKLWDHLFIISDFKLDVDSPYPKPPSDVMSRRPEKLKYHSNGIKYRHYGKNIEFIIDRIAAIDDEEKKEVLVKVLANHLKKSYLTWNRDSVNDEVIEGHLKTLSDGKLTLPEGFTLEKTTDILAKNQYQAKKRKKPQQQRSSNQRYNKRPKRN